MRLASHRLSMLTAVVNTAAVGGSTATMLLAYALLGLAVLHAITRGMNSRPFALGGLYAAVIIFGWPMLLLSVLGLADTAFDLRGRVAAKRTNNSNRP